MEFEHTEVFNFESAIRGMRNPLESWDKSDSEYIDIESEEGIEQQSKGIYYKIGLKDLELMQTLIKAGSEHRKFMRQIFVSVDITAPLYWWKEFDTYKVGTVANSTSTMHKLASTPITMDCFEMDDFEYVNCPKPKNDIDSPTFSGDMWLKLIDYLERLRLKYNELIEQSKKFNEDASEVKDIDKGLYEHFNFEAKKAIEQAAKYWKELIRLLPESWLQKRTVTMNYENLFAMCSKGQRRFHKLSEWSKSFIDWARSLPYAQELIFLDENVSRNELA